jgi:hypothetical protein
MRILKDIIFCLNFFPCVFFFLDLEGKKEREGGSRRKENGVMLV